MGFVVVIYVGYELVLVCKDFKFLVIVMLLCVLLWLWIVGELIDLVLKENLYFDWFDDNKLDD